MLGDSVPQQAHRAIEHRERWIMAGLATTDSSTPVDPKVALVAQVVALNLPQDRLLSVLLDDRPGNRRKIRLNKPWSVRRAGVD